MKYRNQRRWRIIRDYCIGWTLAFVFLTIVRGIGTTENGELQFDLQTSLIMAITIGPAIGAISGYAQILSEERIYKRISIQRLLMLRLIYSVSFVFILVLLAYGVYQLYVGTEVSLTTFAFGEGSFAIYFYVLFVEFSLGVLRQVNLMLGDNNLSRLLLGKFYTPLDEERIFMFLDLQSSTQLAERLGNIQYSVMIQDCFNDLGVVVENEAEIYQYVGDEAVLTWRLRDGLKNQNCIDAYYNFKQQLEEKEEYYLKKYGFKPFFKAGLHAGKVTVTEVGKYKKEIAYHGDAINTAARIQDQCNEFHEELLVSRYLKDQLKNENGYSFNELGSISLRGKEHEVTIYAVKECSEMQSQVQTELVS